MTTAPGAITLYGRSNLIVPDSEAGREFADLFADTFMAMDLREDFVTAAWEKLCLNVASGAVTALTLRTDAVAHVPGMKDLMLRLKRRHALRVCAVSNESRELTEYRIRAFGLMDLFDVFVREKVYLEYARQFLDPEQIDEVDESGIPGYAP